MHSAPRRRVYHVWSQFLLFLCKKPDCVSSLFPLTAQNKSWLNVPHTYSSSNCPFRGRSSTSPLWGSPKLINYLPWSVLCLSRIGILVCHSSLRNLPFPCYYRILDQPLHKQYIYKSSPSKYLWRCKIFMISIVCKHCILLAKQLPVFPEGSLYMYKTQPSHDQDYNYIIFSMFSCIFPFSV